MIPGFAASIVLVGLYLAGLALTAALFVAMQVMRGVAVLAVLSVSLCLRYPPVGLIASCAALAALFLYHAAVGALDHKTFVHFVQLLPLSRAA